MCLGGYAGKSVYKAGKTSALLGGDASGANRCYVVTHCGGGGTLARIDWLFWGKILFRGCNFNFLTPFPPPHILKDLIFMGAQNF